MFNSQAHPHRIKPITLAVAALLQGAGSMAIAADAGEPAKKAELETVVITGIRAAKELSLLRKRDADGVTEVISAEDIGKMPDKNVADSLQRVPGINTSTGTGGNGGYDENDRVSIRGVGAAMSLVTLNSHSVASSDWDYGDMIAGGAGPNTSGSSRSVSFLLLPSSIVSQVVVHKSAHADDIEGGAAGTVNIITHRPLDFKKHLTFELGLQSVYSDQARKADPQLSGLLSWKNKASNFGVMLQVFDEQRHLRRDGQLRSYGTVTAAQANAALPVGTTYVTSVNSQIFEQERQRRGAVLDVQAKPTNALTLNLDTFYSKLSAAYYRQQFGNSYSNSVANNIVPTGVKIDNPLLTEATFANKLNNGNSLQANYNPGASSESRYWAGDFKFDATEDLKLSGMLGSTKSEGKADFYEHFMSFRGVTNSYAMGQEHKPLSLGMPGGLANSNWNFISGDHNHTLASSTDRENFAQFDGEWFVEWKTLNSIKFGWRGADHVREAFRPLKAGWPMNATATGQISSGLPLIAYEGGLFPTDFGSGLGHGAGGNAAAIPSLSPATIQQWSDANLGTDPVFNKPASGPFRVGEKNQALYLMGRLSGDNWRGNVGLRYVRTDVAVRTNTGLSCGVPGTKAANGQTITYLTPALQASECAAFVPPGATLTTSSRFGNFYTMTTENQYSEVLPSANLVVNLDKNLQLRAAAAKTMSRPDYSALGVSIGNFQYNAGRTPASTASGGNPLLGPIVANNYNLGIEWYFKPRALLTAQAFYLDFDSLIGAGSSVQYLFNTAVRDPVTAAFTPTFMDTTVTQPVMTTGKSKGLEFGYEQPVWGGFGINANYSYTDAREASGDPILGAAKNTYNLGAYYEDERFNARIAYTHRSETRIGLFGAQQTFAAPTGTFNASAGFKVNDSLTLTVEGLNLNNPTLRYYNMVPGSTVMREQTTALYNSGRQIYAGLRYKY